MENKVLFLQENVIVFTSGPLKEDVPFSGKLLVANENHGLVVEWHPKEKAESCRKSSPDADSLDWENITVVGYKSKAKGSDSDSVEIKKVPHMPNPIAFDVRDVASFKRLDEVSSSGESKVIVSFFLKDGSSIPSFHFQDITDFLTLLEFLKLHVVFKRSEKDSLLYLVDEQEVIPPTKSFADIQLYDSHKPATFSKVLRDPYMIVGPFSKVANYFFENILYANESSSTSEEYQNEKITELLNDSLPTIHIDHHEESGYELITCFKIPPRVDVKREEAVTLVEWNSFLDAEGRIPNFETLKLRVFKGGLESCLRPEAWKYLVGFYDFLETTKEKAAKWKVKKDYYYTMKLQWKSMTTEQESRFASLRERKNLIEKDVSRTDRTHPYFEGDNNLNLQTLYDILMTYCMYNFDLGYVQGMSDLLSPILVVMQNEEEAFWCFACWMQKIGLNFEMDQLGMKTQLLNLHRLLHFIDTQLCTYLENHESGNLYFAFRWLLILFKRDFKFEEVMRVWEVLWTELPCKNFHLLICIAILDSEKATIMENNYGLTEILKHLNDMAYKMNLEDILCKAEAIYWQIASCNQVPDIVQGILGLSLKNVQEANAAPVEKAEREMPNKSKPSVVQANQRCPKKQTKADSPPNSVSSEEYVDIAEQMDFSFGILT